ncbi:hypothetical protein SAMN05216330_1011282 [Bradyrhizobium sp. Ghvi]|uniref:hypothetical protein n=1 Tax=Bradyrhizobium sp. Ghvi TaxID=1855319 RepID=UPI0008EF9F42|nr:hypothetical protein [Bradyrhizobium sp. Ghvi]SFO02788.1 hypothetical protein SAMN05216330_1011282 [Bradyrhizobium sp. Ghvi]
MGAHPYWYFVPYEDDFGAALQKLREREFKAGRYNPVMPFPTFPVDISAPVPGARHASIEEVMEQCDESGTRSILDIAQVAPAPFDGSGMPFMTAFPLAPPDVERLFGTPNPTREQVATNKRMWDRIERGSAVYTVIFEKGEPHEIFFGGYSFD